MDLTTLTDEDLEALRVDVLNEQDRRRILTEAPARADQIAQQYVAAIGREDGDQWVAPTGAHNAYPQGAIVTHDGKTWESLIPNNVWTPGVSGWRENVAEGHPAWVQPLGAHDSYPLGWEVTHDGRDWTSLVAHNVWAPGLSGWRENVADGYPAWVQPAGAHDAYAKDAKVTHKGRIWTSTAANNVWAPGVYGWTDLGPA